ncbi:MAG TPA: hypothetical protein VH598_00410, partial [Verrucomicrobiae bacterium]|nr:hypothetical protein [Verrucomicrobiae bacterium]
MTTSVVTQHSKMDFSVPTAGVFSGLRAGAPVDATAFLALRRRALLEGYKWDPQVGDVETLSRFPLVMKSNAWKRIAYQAEQLTMEAIAAEQEISRRQELLDHLGLPRALRRILAEKTS